MHSLTRSLLALACYSLLAPMEGVGPIAEALQPMLAPHVA